MGAPDLLRRLREAGFSVAPADGGGIRVVPSATLTDAHWQEIRDHRAELLSLLASPPDPDRWCWPQSEAMNGAEIDAMQARVAVFARRGVEPDEAERLADLLVIRDRQLDDRQICPECTHLGERGRCIAASAGRIKGADRRLEPVPTILQRCEAFGLRKGLQ